MAENRRRDQENDAVLWYRQPAAAWLEALPVGNGRLGGMVFGGVPEERIQLNEDTLWSGGPRPANPLGNQDTLSEIRRLIMQKHALREANEPCKKLQGPYTQSYQPWGTYGYAWNTMVRCRTIVASWIWMRAWHASAIPLAGCVTRARCW